MLYGALVGFMASDAPSRCCNSARVSMGSHSASMALSFPELHLICTTYYMYVLFVTSFIHVHETDCHDFGMAASTKSSLKLSWGLPPWNRHGHYTMALAMLWNCHSAKMSQCRGRCSLICDLTEHTACRQRGAGLTAS